MPSKKTGTLGLNDLLERANIIYGLAGKLTYYCFGGFSDGTEVLVILKQMEKEIQLLQKHIHIVASNRAAAANLKMEEEYYRLGRLLGKNT